MLELGATAYVAADRATSVFAVALTTLVAPELVVEVPVVEALSVVAAPVDEEPSLEPPHAARETSSAQSEPRHRESLIITMFLPVT